MADALFIEAEETADQIIEALEDLQDMASQLEAPQRRQALKRLRRLKYTTGKILDAFEEGLPNEC